MTFTIEDAKDDAKIKQEIQSDVLRTAKRNSKIYEAFENVCENMGQDPRVVLTDMIIRALNDEEYAEGIMGTEVTMDVLNTGEYRKEDVETVKEFAESLDLVPDEKTNPVEQLIRKRLEAVSGGPLDRMSNGDDGLNDKRIKDMESEIERLRRELERERSSGSDSGGGGREDSHSVEGRVDERDEGDRKSLDDIFGEDEEEDIIDNEVSDESGEEEDESGSDMIEINNIGDDQDEEDEHDDEESVEASDHEYTEEEDDDGE